MFSRVLKRTISEHFETPINSTLSDRYVGNEIDSTLRIAQSGTMSFNSKKIFIGNLPFTITKNELESMFSSVSSVSKLYSPNKR